MTSAFFFFPAAPLDLVLVQPGFKFTFAFTLFLGEIWLSRVLACKLYCYYKIFWFRLAFCSASCSCIYLYFYFGLSSNFAGVSFSIKLIFSSDPSSLGLLGLFLRLVSKFLILLSIDYGRSLFNSISIPFLVLTNFIFLMASSSYRSISVCRLAVSPKAKEIKEMSFRSDFESLFVAS